MSKRKTTKSKSSLNSDNFRVELKPFQKTAENFLKSNVISVFTGAPGTGKDFIQIHRAVDGFLSGEFSEIIYMRSVVEVGTGIGFIPGAQPYSSKIYTPDGFTTMGEVEEGDLVYAYDGTPVKVLGTYEQGERDTYEVKTSDGQSTIVCDKHLWTVVERRAKTAKYRKPVTINTIDIKDNLYNDHNRFRYSIPRNNAVEWDTKNLEIHPYVLGALIGDGSLSNSITLTSPDAEIIDRVDSLLVYTEVAKSADNLHNNIKMSNHTHGKKANKVRIMNTATGEEYKYSRVGDVPYKFFGCDNLNTLKGRCYRGSNIDGFSFNIIENKDKYTNPLKNKLDRVGLLYKKSYEKFIPEIYKFGSIDQRLELLRGLLDTDGNVKTNGETTYSTSSKVLAEDVAFVVRSLGGRVFIKERDRIGQSGHYSKEGRKIVNRRLSYEVRINFQNNPGLFHLTRKKERETPTSNLHKNNIVSITKVGRERVKCILIDHPEHLYITDDFIVTHNTEEDKLEPYQQAFLDNLKDMLEKTVYERVHKKVRFEHTGYCRGKTFKRCAIIVSESQNLTLKELMTISTRLADTGKMFINGDKYQVDIKNSGLQDFINLMEGVEGFGHMVLGDEFQMRNQMIVEMNNRYTNFLQEKNGKRR